MKLTMDERQLREKLQHLWCQHCKALQKTNDTVVECWYNPLDVDGAFAFCAANCDAIDAILAEPKIGVLTDDQTLPDNPYTPDFESDIQKVSVRQAAYNNAQNDMVKAGFRRVLKVKV